MAYTLSNLIRDMYAGLGRLKTSTATAAGSTSTLVDNSITEDAEDDDFKGGSLLILRDAGGLGAAPEGELSKVSAFDASTGTFTFSPVLSAPTGSGDEYGFTTVKYTLEEMKNFANMGLSGLKRVGLVNEVQLETAAEQTEYAALAAWKYGGGPLQIDIQTNLGDANDRRFSKISRGLWKYIPSAPGSTGLIQFFFQPKAGSDLRVWYAGEHPRLVNFTDQVNEAIAPKVAYLAGIVAALSAEKKTDDVRISLNNYLDQLREAKVENPIWVPDRDQQRTAFRVLGKVTTNRLMGE